MNLLIGVTASSGVMDLPLYLRIFKESLHADMKLVVTPQVSQFISLDFLKTFVQGQLYDDFFRGDAEIRLPHVDLTRWADVFLILPCTVNTLSKAAHGQADNLLTMLVMYYPDPILFFPNTNPTMWKKKATQRNVAYLLEEGHRVVDPSGNAWESSTYRMLESGHMPPPHATADYIKRFYEASISLKGGEQHERDLGTKPSVGHSRSEP